jgi:two-component system sensor histidine kinase YesM
MADFLKKVKISYKSFLLVIFVALSFILLLFIALQSYSRASDYILEHTQSLSREELVQANQLLEDSLQQIGGITRLFAESEDLGAWISQFDSKHEGTRSILQQDITDIATKMMIFNGYVDGIAVISHSNSIYVNVDEYRKADYEYLKKQLFDTDSNITIDEASGLHFFLPDFEGKIHDKNSAAGFFADKYYFFAPTIANGVEQGGVFVFVDNTIFMDVFNQGSNIGKDKNFAILSKHNHLIYKNNTEAAVDEIIQTTPSGRGAKQDSVYQFKSKGDNIFEINSKTFGWSIIYFQQASFISEKLSMLKFFFVIAFLISILLAVTISSAVSDRITKPLKELMKFISGFKLGQKNNRYKDFRKRKSSLQLSILYDMIITVILPSIVLSVLSYVYTVNVVKNYIIESNKNLFYYTEYRLEKFMEDKVKVLSGISFDNKIQKYFSKKEALSEFDIENIIDKYILIGSGRDEYLFYNYYDQSIYTDYRNYDPSKTNRDKMEKTSGLFIWDGSWTDRYRKPVINLQMKVNSVSAYNMLGYIDCRIKEESIEEIFKGISKDHSSVFIINDKDIIVSHTDDNLLGVKVLMDIFEEKDGTYYGNNRFSFIAPLANSSWRIVAFYENNIFDRDINQLLLGKIYILGMFLVIVILASYIIAYNSTRNLGKMQMLLERFEMGSMMEEYPEESRIEEISQLGNAFNEMIDRTEILMDQLLVSTRKQNDLENMKKDAEFIALQAQINPHFLYNTFECINWMIKSGDKEQAVKMVTALSDMMRFVAKSESMIVTIEQELHHTMQYIEIMELKYNRDIEFHIDIPEYLYKCQTIKLLLQPVVENSIYHGIGFAKGCQGVISIKCREKDEELEFIVEDNGKGIPEDKLIELVKGLNSGIFYSKIGIFNVQNRIKLFYGEAYGLRIASSEKGTTVIMLIPKKASDVEI